LLICNDLLTIMLAAARLSDGRSDRMTPASPDERLEETARAIQSRGWAIVCDGQASRVVGHSANLPGLLPKHGESEFRGLALRDLLGSESAHSLRNALSRSVLGPRPAFLPRLPIAGREGLFDFAVHAKGELTVIEIETAARTDPFALDRTRALIDRLGQAKDLDRLLQTAARLNHSLLQWDCVAVLRLAPDGATRVLAQHRRADWPDAAAGAALFGALSPQARALYGADQRFLADAAAPPVAMIGDAPEEINWAHLQAATADEAARAAEAGFKALFSLPITVDGKSWGLLVAHDRAARGLTMDERAVFALFADVLSLSVQSVLWRPAAEEFHRTHAL
jgi:light-regulated signal transduction histidine kinase (bacteriophytochrome)